MLALNILEKVLHTCNPWPKNTDKRHGRQTNTDLVMWRPTVLSKHPERRETQPKGILMEHRVPIARYN